MEDTIVGVATAAGEGGVAIVRVSGPEAVRMIEHTMEKRHFVRRGRSHPTKATG